MTSLSAFPGSTPRRSGLPDNRKGPWLKARMIRRIKEIEMETMLKFRCNGCDKEFTVTDRQVDTDILTCPHCQEKIEVPEIDDEG